MRIALFLGSLGMGGAEAVAVSLANEFRARGCHVNVVLARESGPFAERLGTGICVHPLQCKHVRQAVAPLITYLQETKPDVLLSSLTNCNIVALRARKRVDYNLRVAVSEHIVDSEHRTNAVTTAKRVMMRYLAKRAYRDADHVIAVSSGVADDVGGAFDVERHRIEVIHNPFELDEIQSLSEAHVEHPWLGSTEIPVILAAGRLTRQKSFGTLLRAFSIVRRAVNARLIILGEGADREELEALRDELELSDVVDLPGFDPNPYAYMAKASQFVLSSAWEGFGNVLVEAMACGCPVVSTNCRSGPSEILANGRYGLLVPVGDPDALAQAMKSTLRAPVSSRKLRDRAGDFSSDRIAAQYLSVLCKGMEM